MIGVILIGAGVFLFLMIQYFNTTLGQTFRILSYLFIIGGVIFSVIGATSKGKTVQQSRDRYCPSCGRSIPFDALVCPYCKKDFEEK